MGACEAQLRASRKFSLRVATAPLLDALSSLSRPTNQTAYFTQEVKILLELCMFLQLVSVLSTRALSIFTVLALIGCAITIRVVFTRFPEMCLQANTTRIFNKCRGS